MEDLPQELLIESSSINVEFLENKTGQITVGEYFGQINKFCKKKYLKNRANKITYQKAKYQENHEVQLAYKKCKHLEIA